MATLLNQTLFVLYIAALSNLIMPSHQTFCEDESEAVPANRIEKTSHLHFFFHDIVSGKHPTAVKVIGTDPYGFGATSIFDDALTEGPERTSRVVGKAQGMYSIAAQKDLALLMVMNFVFVEGKYNGSSITLLGRNYVYDDVREIPIVGGTGHFRFARGYALAHTHVFDIKSGDATVEYNLFVQHF